MALTEFLKRFFGRDQEPGASGHEHDEGHASEFSRPKKDATPEEAERRSEHIRRDHEARRKGKRP